MTMYTTVLGDTWDLIAWRVYGDCNYTGLLMRENRALLDTLIFSAGVMLKVPPIPEYISQKLPYWRREET